LNEGLSAPVSGEPFSLPLVSISIKTCDTRRKTMTNKERINSTQKIARLVELTRSGKVLVVTLLFRLLFGGYLIGMDQYRFNDGESALTVLLIYGLIGLFATRFISGRRDGLLGLIGLDAIFIVLQTVFTILTLSQIVDPGLHDPLVNWWAALLMYLFSLLTFIFSLRANRETNLSCTHIPRSPINS
jgi:hypothetical protein